HRHAVIAVIDLYVGLAARGAAHSIYETYERYTADLDAVESLPTSQHGRLGRVLDAEQPQHPVHHLSAPLEPVGLLRLLWPPGLRVLRHQQNRPIGGALLGWKSEQVLEHLMGGRTQHVGRIRVVLTRQQLRRG